MIEKLTKKDLNCNIFSVYDYDGLTMQELLCQFFTKINECVDTSNKAFDLMTWLKEQGLEEEVIKKLNELILDGTIKNLINQELFNDLNNKIDLYKRQSDEQFNTKANFCSTLTELKTTTKIKNGMTVSTLGYSKINDGGNANYYITDISDSNSIQETLNNGLFATLIDREINPKMLGCKCDGVTDDTIAFQKFLNLFSNKKYRLVSNEGTILITSPVYLKGVFASEQELYELDFINTKIKYTGNNPFAIYIYGHKNSKIKGLSLSNDSNGFIGITSFWYSEIIDMQCKELKFNVSKELIPDYPSEYGYDINTVKISDSRLLNVVFNNVGYSNSIVFDNCIMLSNSSYDYICEFYGVTFNNVKFINCDMSYSNKSIFKLNDYNVNGSILLEGCYFDSSLPLTLNYNGWSINQLANFEATNTANDCLIEADSFSKSMKFGCISKNGNKINTYLKNMALNGNLWNLGKTGNDLYGTTIGSPSTYNIVDSTKTINGKCLRVALQLGGTVSLYGSKALTTGHYTTYVRFKLDYTNGNGKLLIGLRDKSMAYNISDMVRNKEYILTMTSDTFIEEGKGISLTLTAHNTTDTVTLEIYEYGFMFGTTAIMGCDLDNPLLQYCNSTNRPIPTPNMIGFNLFDTTLNKRINWTGAKWIDSNGTDV